MGALRRIGRGMLTTWEVVSFVLRELGGWFLVLAALYGMNLFLHKLETEKTLEASLMIPLIIFTFRGGIHLLKVSVAARICLFARDRAETSSEA